MAGITGLPQLQKNMERLMDESKEWITPARPQLEHMTTWGGRGGVVTERTRRNTQDAAAQDISDNNGLANQGKRPCVRTTPRA